MIHIIVGKPTPTRAEKCYYYFTVQKEYKNYSSPLWSCKILIDKMAIIDVSVGPNIPSVVAIDIANIGFQVNKKAEWQCSADDCEALLYTNKRSLPFNRRRTIRECMYTVSQKIFPPLNSLWLCQILADF